jgi:hypothetical protein
MTSKYLWLFTRAFSHLVLFYIEESNAKAILYVMHKAHVKIKMVKVFLLLLQYTVSIHIATSIKHDLIKDVWYKKCHYFSAVYFNKYSGEVVDLLTILFCWVVTPWGDSYVHTDVSIFSPEDGDSMFFRNVGIYLRVHKASQPRTFSLPWEPQITSRCVVHWTSLSYSKRFINFLSQTGHTCVSANSVLCSFNRESCTNGM